MKFSRKLVTLGLTGAMTLAFAACGGGQPQGSESPTAGESQQPTAEAKPMTMLIGSWARPRPRPSRPPSTPGARPR